MKVEIHPYMASCPLEPRSRQGKVLASMATGCTEERLKVKYMSEQMERRFGG